MKTSSKEFGFDPIEMNLVLDFLLCRNLLEMLEVHASLDLSVIESECLSHFRSSYNACSSFNISSYWCSFVVVFVNVVVMALLVVTAPIVNICGQQMFF